MPVALSARSSAAYRVLQALAAKTDEVVLKQAHDLHICPIASGIYALSVHVGISNSEDRDCLTWELEEILHHRFGIEHNTIQLEGPEYHNPQVCPLTRLEELTG